MRHHRNHRSSPKRAPLACAIALCGLAGHAQAIDFDTGNPDVSLQWSNTIRYNAGFRVEDKDMAIALNPSSDESDNSYDKHDMVTNRIDLLSEFDFNYQRRLGVRISAAAWYDAAFNSRVKTAPGLEGRCSYIDCEFSNKTRRYHEGFSGEILDAYFFNNFEIGDSIGSFRVGRQTNLWGEALVLSTHSVSYAQSPSDGFKGVMTPGVDAKEISLPVGQLYADWQVTPNLTLAGQYFFEWQETRLAQGGTYLAGTDFLLDGPERYSLAPGRFLVNQGIVKPDSSGDFGLSARWQPAAIPGTVGFYYREFDERSPTLSLDLANDTYRFVYPEDAKLYGISYARSLGGVSFGSELVYREDTALASAITDGAPEGARGRTYHALANAVASLGPNGFWDSASLTAEIAYSKLDSVTSGEQYFNGCYKRAAGDRGAETGCITSDNWQTSLRITPTWAAVWAGWDISATAGVTYGIKGNGAVLGGGNEGAGSFTIGATFTYNAQHDFTIAYNDYLATHELTDTGTIRVSNGSQLQDRGWLSLTYKGSF